MLFISFLFKPFSFFLSYIFFFWPYPFIVVFHLFKIEN
jgi:hypothetical protein